MGTDLGLSKEMKGDLPYERGNIHMTPKIIVLPIIHHPRDIDHIFAVPGPKWSLPKGEFTEKDKNLVSCADRIFFEKTWHRVGACEILWDLTRDLQESLYGIKFYAQGICSEFPILNPNLNIQVISIEKLLKNPLEKGLETILRKIKKNKAISHTYCNICKGSGSIYDPEDPIDPVEGNKMRSLISCPGE